jgi:hypothetical protein
VPAPRGVRSRPGSRTPGLSPLAAAPPAACPSVAPAARSATATSRPEPPGLCASIGLPCRTPAARPVHHTSATRWVSPGAGSMGHHPKECKTRWERTRCERPMHHLSGRAPDSARPFLRRDMPSWVHAVTGPRRRGRWQCLTRWLRSHAKRLAHLPCGLVRFVAACKSPPRAGRRASPLAAGLAGPGL